MYEPLGKFNSNIKSLLLTIKVLSIKLFKFVILFFELTLKINKQTLFIVPGKGKFGSSNLPSFCKRLIDNNPSISFFI